MSELNFAFLQRSIEISNIPTKKVSLCVTLQVTLILIWNIKQKLRSRKRKKRRKKRKQIQIQEKRKTRHRHYREEPTLQGGTEETDEDNKETEEGKKEVDSKETATDYGIISGGAIVAVLVLLGVGAIIAIIVYRKRRYVLVYPMDDCYTIEPEHAS